MTESHGTSRRNFLAWTTAAGAGVAASTLIPGTASAATPTQNTNTTLGETLAPSTFDPIRPPAVPLAVRSPYLNTWLAADNSSGTWPTFWTGRVTGMSGIIRIDGTPYLFLGSEPSLTSAVPYPLATMRQITLQVTPTQSRFVLQNAGVELDLTFFSPVEPGDLVRQSRPLSYVTATVKALDGKTHAVEIYLDISGEWGSGSTDTQIAWNSQQYASGSQNIISLNYAPATPRVLTENGDTAEWGTTVWSTADRTGLTWQIGADADTRTQFVTKGVLTNTSDADQPRAINNRWPVFGFALTLPAVTKKASVPLVISVGHVREPAVSYLGTPLPPLWKSYYPDWQGMIGAFHADYSAALTRSAALDHKVTSDATNAGGAEYAALCALALRQAYAGTELVSKDGVPWVFLKEISSDGNMSTTDLIYPCMPVFVYLDPAYLGMLLAPTLDYVENHPYPKTFAPHDLGSSYPNANGHLDGTGEEDMPVEETANMVILTAAYLARIPRTARAAFATKHYAILKQWADYLVENALDPGSQNQTDDFTGFISHSVNLALKGILAIGAMGQIATAAGKTTDASGYTQTSRGYITQWASKAMDSSNDHLKLAYDQDGTWSLKYNGYPDRLLGLGLIPSYVSENEATWYFSRANSYGVPLDIRHTYTKNDWEMWTAAWLKNDAPIRKLLIDTVFAYANSTPNRLPVSDWNETVNATVAGFRNRPVVGGWFALLTV